MKNYFEIYNALRKNGMSADQATQLASNYCRKQQQTKQTQKRELRAKYESFMNVRIAQMFAEMI